MISTPEERVATLTPRELDVARLAARGFSARYIARRYGISDRTVETHTRHIYEKLLVSTRDALIESFAGLLLAPAPEPTLVFEPTPVFEPKLAGAIIPIGATIAPATPALPISTTAPIEPTAMHIMGPVGVLCGVANPTHMTNGTRYADCPACLEAAERLIRAATRPSCDAICDAASGGSCFTPWCRCSCHKTRS